MSPRLYRMTEEQKHLLITKLRETALAADIAASIAKEAGMPYEDFRALADHVADAALGIPATVQ
jgi:hypothetical protein